MLWISIFQIQRLDQLTSKWFQLTKSHKCCYSNEMTKLREWVFIKIFWAIYEIVNKRGTSYPALPYKFTKHSFIIYILQPLVYKVNTLMHICVWHYGDLLFLFTTCFCSVEQHSQSQTYLLISRTQWPIRGVPLPAQNASVFVQCWVHCAV